MLTKKRLERGCSELKIIKIDPETLVKLHIDARLSNGNIEPCVFFHCCLPLAVSHNADGRFHTTRGSNNSIMLSRIETKPRDTTSRMTATGTHNMASTTTKG